jgi:hypothetical protein
MYILSSPASDFEPAPRASAGGVEIGASRLRQPWCRLAARQTEQPGPGGGGVGGPGVTMVKGLVQVGAEGVGDAGAAFLGVLYAALRVGEAVVEVCGGEGGVHHYAPGGAHAGGGLSTRSSSSLEAAEGLWRLVVAAVATVAAAVAAVVVVSRRFMTGTSVLVAVVVVWSLSSSPL